jgi:DHA1 family tetracycline resistance protein-like MFS transporter
MADGGVRGAPTKEEEEEAARKKYVAGQIRSLQVVIVGMIGGIATLLPQNSPIIASVMPTASPAQVGAYVARCATLGSLTEFLINPVVGALGDQYGRKPILVAGFCATSFFRALAYFRSDSKWIVAMNLVLTRGIDTVNFTTTRAALSDLVSGQEYAEAFPKIAIAAGISVVVFPLVSLGIVRLTKSHLVTLLMSSGLSIFSLLTVSSRLTETLTEERRKPFLWKNASPFAFVEVLTASSTLTKLMTTSMVQTIIDGRNLADTDFAFQRSELGWSEHDSGRFVAAAGLKILLGGMIGRRLVRAFGVRRIGSFSNLMNSIQGSLMFMAPSFSMYWLFVGMFGDRKRDGVESMVTDLGVKLGYGKGKIAAALYNWRSVGNIIAPVLFSYTLALAIRLKKSTGIAWLGRLHYLLAISVSVLAECVYRTVDQNVLDQELRNAKSGQQPSLGEEKKD